MLQSPLVFPLAPMNLPLRVMTGVLLCLPPLFAALAFLGAPLARASLGGTAALFALLYASVWLLWRPARFELDPTGLWIVWPLRRRFIPRGTLGEASAIEAAEFRRRHGFGMRVGAGGLWGGFGLLRTRQETFSMWISRTDAFVLVRLRGARTLLITPDRPREFLEALAALRDRPAPR